MWKYTISQLASPVNKTDLILCQNNGKSSCQGKQVSRAAQFLLMHMFIVENFCLFVGRLKWCTNTVFNTQEPQISITPGTQQLMGNMFRASWSGVQFMTCFWTSTLPQSSSFSITVIDLNLGIWLLSELSYYNFFVLLK